MPIQLYVKSQFIPTKERFGNYLCQAIVKLCEQKIIDRNQL